MKQDKNKLNLEGLLKERTIETRKDDVGNNFVQIKNKVTTTLGITDEAFRLLAYLKSHDLSRYSPGYEQIMNDLVWSRSKVIRSIRNLEANRIIERVNEPNKFLRLAWVQEGE